MGASQHLEEACQFGFVLPFDLFFFSPDVHIIRSVEQHGVRFRDPDCRPGLRPSVHPGCSSEHSSSSLPSLMVTVGALGEFRSSKAERPETIDVLLSTVCGCHGIQHLREGRDFYLQVG